MSPDSSVKPPLRSWYRRRPTLLVLLWVGWVVGQTAALLCWDAWVSPAPIWASFLLGVAGGVALGRLANRLLRPKRRQWTEDQL